MNKQHSEEKERKNANELHSNFQMFLFLSTISFHSITSFVNAPVHTVSVICNEDETTEGS